VAPVFCAVVAPGFGAACEVWAYADTEQTEKVKPKAMTKNDFIASSKLLKPEINGNNVAPHLKSGHCVIPLWRNEKSLSGAGASDRPS
jgi:hypothetical protein